MTPGASRTPASTTRWPRPGAGLSSCTRCSAPVAPPGWPPVRQRSGPVSGGFFSSRLAALQAAGIAADRLIIDPGLGYFLGSSPEPSLRAQAGIRELRARFAAPVLVCPSRKSFLRTLPGKDTAHAGAATLAAELFAAGQ